MTMTTFYLLYLTDALGNGNVLCQPQAASAVGINDFAVKSMMANMTSELY